MTVRLDASYGEGGGQVLRTALSLAVVRGWPVRLTRIRAGRPRPGLQPQHLAVVQALAAISDAQVTGAQLDSTQLAFDPRRLRGGDYHFDVGAVRGSAGSTSLLFQALLLPLALASSPSRLTLVGGTHVPWSPPVDYLTAVFLPVLRQIGVQARVALKRPGWYPKGGGAIEVEITPSVAIGPLRWEGRTQHATIAGVSVVSRLPRSIAERQRRRALERLAARGHAAEIALVEDSTALGTGTMLFLAATGPGHAGGASALGRPGLPAEAVADQAVEGLLAYLDSHAAADDHLADQLVPFLALAREGSVLTCPSLSDHLRTVAWVVQQFVDTSIDLGAGPPARVNLAPGARHPGSEPS